MHANSHLCYGIIMFTHTHAHKYTHTHTHTHLSMHIHAHIVGSIHKLIENGKMTIPTPLTPYTNILLFDCPPLYWHKGLFASDVDMTFIDPGQREPGIVDPRSVITFDTTKSFGMSQWTAEVFPHAM